MEACQLFIKKLIRRFDHEERIEIFLLVVEGRVRLDGALVVALWVGASVGVRQTDGLLAASFVNSKCVSWELLKEEGLKLDQDCFHCISGCPSLVDLFLLWVKDI